MSQLDQPVDHHDPLIVIASNRGPYRFFQEDDGSFTVKRGAGGLVTALSALAQKHEVLWVASAMNEDDRAWALANANTLDRVDGIYMKLIRPDEAQYDQYYNEIANPLLWYIQHQLWDTVRNPVITQQTWEAWSNGYVALNRQFANAIADAVQDTKRPLIVLPQDYHLYLAPKYLRERLGYQVQIQPFVHIPWPGPDAWRILPGQMRNEILTSLLASDRVGFQTKKDAFNFVQCCRFYLEDAHSRGARDAIYYEGRRVGAYHYPISVDVDRLESMTEEAETRLLKSQILNFTGDQQLILRVDRIEPSKNILRGLEAYRALLETHPEHQGNVSMMALLVPSRMEVSEYQDYLRDIMAEAGMINARFSDEFWEPVRILVGDNYARAIAAMQVYDVLLVNPIADGMNLVAKEGVLVNQRMGVLVLSEHAGAFYELGEHALTVSPFDIYGTMNAMHEGLVMNTEEREARAEALRRMVQEAEVGQWFNAQVEDALRTSNSQANNASTSETPEANRSADSSTA